jgi:hypothetical protein
MCRIFRRILSVQQNTIMDLNNIMKFHRYNNKDCQKLSKIAPVKVTVTRVFSTNWVSISMGFKGNSLLSSDKQISSHLHDQNASKPKREFLGDKVPTTTHNKCNYAINTISGGGGSFKSDQSLRQQGRWKEGVVTLTCIGRKSLEFSFCTSIYVSGWLTMFKSLIYKFELHNCITLTMWSWRDRRGVAFMIPLLILLGLKISLLHTRWMRIRIANLLKTTSTSVNHSLQTWQIN